MANVEAARQAKLSKDIDRAEAEVKSADVELRRAYEKFAAADAERRGREALPPVTEAEAKAAELVASLKAREAARRARLHEIAAERRAGALPAANGDPGASKRLRKLAVEAADVERELADLALALADAEGAESEARQAAAEQRANDKVAGARAIGEKIVEVSERGDTAFADAARGIAELDAVRTALAKTGTMRSEHLGQVVGPGSLLAALAAAGLHRRIDGVSAHRSRALADLNRALMRMIMRPAVAMPAIAARPMP